MRHIVSNRNTFLKVYHFMTGLDFPFEATSPCNIVLSHNFTYFV